MPHRIVNGVNMPRLLTLTFLLLFSSTLHAAAITLNFEGFPDGTNLTTQYSGVTFTSAIVLTSGIGVNELEFPPHSGINVISDNGGPIDIAFSTPVTSVNGYVTYLQPVELSAYDSTNHLVATAMSQYSDNDALFGDAGSNPNENIGINSSSGISNIQIVGSSGGGSFTLDDLSFSIAVPEIDVDSGAGAVGLLAGILLILRGGRRESKSTSRLWLGGHAALQTINIVHTASPECPDRLSFIPE